MTLYAGDSLVRDDRVKEYLTLQRVSVLAAATAYFIAGLWNLFYVESSLYVGVSCFVVTALTYASLALTNQQNTFTRIDALPVLIAIVFSAHTALSMTVEQSGIAQQFPHPFSLIALFVSVLATRFKSALAAIAASIAIGFAAYFYVGAAPSSVLNPGIPFIFWGSGIAIAVILAWALEQARKKSYILRLELERRATSDDLTGVSNRAHINLLAQNEFARARRYGEPYSCLMLEVDGFDKIKSAWGAHAADVVAQVLSGYCVVIMRHCDSFGRLTPQRFLALLPETEGEGALTLALRMCRDAAALKVQTGGHSISFTVSIGVAELHPSDRWAGDMLRRTEQALDDAIERGRNNAVLAELPPSMADLEGHTA